MTNPLLTDPVSHVIRDLQCENEWNDHLIGSAIQAIEAGVYPVNLLKWKFLVEKHLLTDGLKKNWPSDVWLSGNAEQFILPITNKYI